MGNLFKGNVDEYVFTETFKPFVGDSVRSSDLADASVKYEHARDYRILSIYSLFTCKKIESSSEKTFTRYMQSPNNKIYI